MEFKNNEFTYRNEYNRQKYDRVGLMLPKGQGEEWKAEAKRRNMSLNAFIIEAVNLYLNNSNPKRTFSMSNFTTMTYGNTIALCVRKNMTINDLMIKLNISEDEMLNIEKNGIANDETLDKICKYFNVSIGELTFGTIYHELKD